MTCDRLIVNPIVSAYEMTLSLFAQALMSGGAGSKKW